MKTIGLIGGMSWESSAEYYRIINKEANSLLGGVHSADCLMYSFDFHDIETLQHAGKWDELENVMINAGLNLKKGGADFIVICTNTMHLYAGEVERETGLPVLHIADAASAEIKEKGVKKVGLLGTRFTMEMDFYSKRMKDKWGIEVIIPPKEQRKTVHLVIYNELVLGKYREKSRREYVKIIDGLAAEGAEGIVLGCTEIPFLVSQKDSLLPVFDTTGIHARAAVKYALSE